MASNTATGYGDTNKPRKTKPSRPKVSQLDRVKKWDPSHLAAVLQAGGIGLGDFQKQGRFQQGETFRTAYDAYKNRNNPAYFSQPLTLAQAQQQAGAAANLKYGAEESALNQQITNTPVWYQQYKDSLAGARTAAQTYTQGLIDASNQVANQVGQAVLGSLQDQQAAESRKALAQAGTNLLANTGAANDQYFGGRPAVADASQIAAMTKLLTEKRRLVGEKADYQTSVLGNLRAQSANTSIAQQTLGVNQASKAATTAENVRHHKASEKNAADATQAAADAAAAKGKEPNKYGIPADQWARWSTSHRRRVIDEASAKGKSDAATTKHSAAIKTATGKARTTIQDIQDAWAHGGTMPAPTPQNPNARRKATRPELRHLLEGKYGATSVSIMERVRKGQALTPEQVQYLRDKYGPNFRIPREWLNGKNSNSNYGGVGRGADTT